MRPLLFCFLLALAWLAASPARAQDLIIDLQGNELTGQVIEITPGQVLYRPDSTDVALPPVVLDKQTLFMIRFANGTREVFGQNLQPALPSPTRGPVPPAPAQPAGMTAQDLYRRGQQDALRLHSYKGAFWGTYAATLTTGYGGIIVGGAVGFSRPKAARNPLIEQQLLSYPAYVEGYEVQARRRKMGKAAEGFGVALATQMAVIILFIAALVAQ